MFPGCGSSFLSRLAISLFTLVDCRNALLHKLYYAWLLGEGEAPSVKGCKRSRVSRSSGLGVPSFEYVVSWRTHESELRL